MAFSSYGGKPKGGGFPPLPNPRRGRHRLSEKNPKCTKFKNTHFPGTLLKIGEQSTGNVQLSQILTLTSLSESLGVLNVPRCFDLNTSKQTKHEI